MTIRVFVSTALLCLTCSFGIAAQSPADTEQNRIAATERYLTIMPMEDMIADMTQEMVKTMPAEAREPFSRMMLEEVRLDVLEQAAKDSMVKHFTVTEINALADFYESPTGYSVMKKMGVYTADVMPVIQQEVMRAVQNLSQQ